MHINLPTVILDPITCLAKGSFESSDLITTTGFIAYFSDSFSSTPAIVINKKKMTRLPPYSNYYNSRCMK